MNDAQSSSVRHLQVLYAAVVGVGLAVVMGRFIEAQGDEVIVRWVSVPVLLSYVVTLVPFYHGAQRHLDQRYILNPVHTARIGALLLADFSILFVESCFLFALAAFVGRPSLFGWTLVLLLIVDTVWGFVFRAATPQEPSTAELGWAKVNSAAVIIFTMVLTLISLTGQLRDDLTVGLLILTIATARTFADYRVSWSYYFPLP